MFYYFKENNSHQNRISNLKYIVHVNGIRGKSSVTRLIGEIFIEAGVKTFIKTTGSAARLIFPDGDEKKIRRRVPNIIEQVNIVQTISRYRPEAFVVECMAVDPLLQKVCEEKMLNSTIGVLTNVREDHQDKMGWSLSEIAHSLCEFIPSNSVLVCGEQNPKLVRIIKKRAKEKNTRVVRPESDLFNNHEKILEQMGYIEHRENIALALKVAEVVGIDKKTAIRGVLNSKPDPGALKIHFKVVDGKKIFFINAHAINDRESVIKVYDLLKERGYLDKTNIGVLYNRIDRPDRVKMFADVVSKEMNLDAVILLGYYKSVAKSRLVENGFSKDKIFSLNYDSLKGLLSLICRLTKVESNVIGMVNYHGSIVEKTVEFFSN